MNLGELGTILGESLDFETLHQDQPGGEGILIHTCRFPNVKVHDRGFVITTTGRGETRKAAMNDYAGKLSGQWVSNGDQARNFLVPCTILGKHSNFEFDPPVTAKNPMMEKEQAKKGFWRGFVPILGVFAFAAALVGVGVVGSNTQIQKADKGGYKVTMFSESADNVATRRHRLVKQRAEQATKSFVEPLMAGEAVKNLNNLIEDFKYKRYKELRAVNKDRKAKGLSHVR